MISASQVTAAFRNHRSFVSTRLSSAFTQRISQRLVEGRVWQKLHNACYYVYHNGRDAFTIHPAESQETYLQHLWFTVKISLRLTMLGLVMFTHGVFPFLFTRTVSGKIEQVYLIMRGRIPQARRTTLDGEYEI